MPGGREAVPDPIGLIEVDLVGRLSVKSVMGQGRAISSLITGVSQLRTGTSQMSMDVAGFLSRLAVGVLPVWP